MLATLLMPVVRHALTTFGGALVGGGYMSSGDLETAVGAVMALIGVVLSITNALKSKSQ